MKTKLSKVPLTLFQIVFIFIISFNWIGIQCKYNLFWAGIPASPVLRLADTSGFIVRFQNPNKFIKLNWNNHNFIKPLRLNIFEYFIWTKLTVFEKKNWEKYVGLSMLKQFGNTLWILDECSLVIE